MEREGTLRCAQHLGQPFRSIVPLVVAQGDAVIAHKVEERESERAAGQRQVVECAHGPIARVDQDDRMACARADVVHVGGDSGIGAGRTHAGRRIDVETDVVRAIGVIVQIGCLEDRDLRVSVDLRMEPNRNRECR